MQQERDHCAGGRTSLDPGVSLIIEVFKEPNKEQILEMNQLRIERIKR